MIRQDYRIIRIYSIMNLNYSVADLGFSHGVTEAQREISKDPESC